MSWMPEPPSIKDIASRRPDLSTFLVHLTKDTEHAPAIQNLASILNGARISACSPMGMAIARFREVGQQTPASQNCVSFTETPLEQVCWLCGEIQGRQNNFSFQPYGVAVTKKYARGVGDTGAVPVWYLDMTQVGGKYRGWLCHSVNNIIDAAITPNDPANAFQGSDIEKLAPYIDTMGTTKDFWWEREWRYSCDFPLPDPTIVLCPEARQQQLGAMLNPQRSWPMIDPMWSLEQIIAQLAGIPSSDIGPV